MGHIAGIGPNSGALLGFTGLENTAQKFKPLIPGISFITNILSATQGIAGSLSLQNASFLAPIPPSFISMSNKISGLFSGGKSK